MAQNEAKNSSTIMPRGTDENALPFVGEPPGGGRIHIGRGNKDQQHDAQFMAFTAKTPAGEGVAQFVNQLDDHEHAYSQKRLIQFSGDRKHVGGVLEAAPFRYTAAIATITTASQTPRPTN